ncbi:hypothetical protein [Alloactinosynnema sp. L-07]|nr:hypothetical protein [Alloactinosynnema sp. L-07]
MVGRGWHSGPVVEHVRGIGERRFGARGDKSRAINCTRRPA